MNKPKEILVAEFDPRIKKYIFTYVLLVMLITVVFIPLALIWVFGLGQLISRRYYDNLVCDLSTKNLSFKKGAFFKIEKTIPLENIQDLTFIQNPILNMFGLQILKIETASSGTPNQSDMKLIGIINASNFKETVLRQREMLVTKEQTGSSKDTDSIISLLKDIKKLLEKNS
jgi:putative membrane protein